MEKIQNWLYFERQLLENISNTLTSNLVSLLILVGTFAMAAVPALLTGISVYFFTLPEWGTMLAGIMAVASGVGIESVGISSAFVSLKLYNQWKRDREDATRLVVAILLSGGYAVAVGAVIFFIDNLPGAVVGFGIASPWLALMLYVARGLYQDVLDAEAERRLIKQARTEAEIVEIQTTAANKHELAKMRAEFKHQERMAQISVPETVPVERTWNGNGTPKQRYETWVREGNDPNALSAQQLADLFKIGKTTAWRWKNE